MAKSCPQIENWCNTQIKCIRTSILWTIDKFSLITENTRVLKSSTFSAKEDPKTEWYLKLYPNGENEEEDNEYVSLYLYMNAMDCDEMKTEFAIAVIDANRQIYKQKVSERRFTSGKKGWGFPLIRRSLLTDPSNQLLPDDRFTIYCEVTTFGKCETKSGRIQMKYDYLLDDMTKLFENSTDYDFDIVVEGYTFKAHKFVLKLRSTVFAAMFELTDKKQNQVVINDIEKNVFARLLRFLYTDRVECNDIESNVKLLSAADKYNIEALKSICEQFIGSQLSVGSVSDVLILSDRLSAKELRNKSIDFIYENFMKVALTSGWKRILQRPDLSDIFIKN